MAVVDSGIRSSADFGSRVVDGVNFSPDAASADDTCGHGTQVAGIVAGNGTNSIGSQYTQTYFGIAPQANLINVRVLDSQGSGSVSQVIAGISWAVVHRSTYNIRIINFIRYRPGQAAADAISVKRPKSRGKRESRWLSPPATTEDSTARTGIPRRLA